MTNFNADLQAWCNGRPTVPRFFMRSYGCQMNDRDSEKMAALLATVGFEQAATEPEADLIIFNTCCVRESATDKVYGHIRALKNAGKMIAVGGCMPQQDGIAEGFAERHKYVNIIFGTGNRHRLPEFLWQYISTGSQVVNTEEHGGLPEITGVPVTVREHKHKAGVNIMFGCDNFCSFCIVPYVRGREKSRMPEDVTEECRALAADGVREITLLGQNVNSYKYGFADLLHSLHEIEDLQRIRFMTSHPKDFPDELIGALTTLPKLCKHVHLPLQSGSTRILAEMNRHYSHEEFISLAQRLQAIPGMQLSTDVIVAYPGETEEDFVSTLKIMEKVRFSGVFTFIYSPRTGTPAAERTDTIPREISRGRFDRLLATIHPIQQEIQSAKIGQTLPVMADGPGRGYTDNHTLVHFPGGPAAGEIVPIRITEAKTFYLKGEIV